MITLPKTSILLSTFIVFPLLFLLYSLLPETIADLFNTLKANDVIGEPRKARPSLASYEQFVLLLVAWIDSRWLAAGALFISGSYPLYRIVVIEPQIASSATPSWLRIATAILVSPMLYATFLCIMRLLLALAFTNMLFYIFPIKIMPLHSDGSGGFGVLRHILWVSVVLMLWDAVLLLSALLSVNLDPYSPYEILLLGIIYLVLTPSLLIGWLLLPHQAMVKARDEVLQPLVEEFQKAFAQYKTSVKLDTSTIVAESSRLSALKQNYDMVRNTFPTWPLQINTIGHVVGTAALPVLLSALIPLILPLFAPLISLIRHALRLP